jgi:hypothetical protein
VKRREFITLLGGAAAWPLAARAQTAGKRPLIGYLETGRKEAVEDRDAAFVEGMRDLGFRPSTSPTVLPTTITLVCRCSRRSWYGSSRT